MNLKEYKQYIKSCESEPFMKEIKSLINKHCLENESDTPDFILAKYIKDCLNAFNDATRSREQSKGGGDITSHVICTKCGKEVIKWFCTYRRKEHLTPDQFNN